MHVRSFTCVVSQRFLALLGFGVIGLCHTVAETAYFVMSGPARLHSNPTYRSYVNYPLVSEITNVSDDARVVNVSARGFVGSGEQVLIAGLVISGTVPRNIVVRGLGPSLQRFGVTAAVDDPKIEVFRGETKIAQNDNWEDGNLGDQSQAATRYNWYLPPDPKEPAMWLSLPPGAYTIMLKSPSGESGIGLIEAYDATLAKN